mmetsp:Transcript_73365/g.177036  ORF Transcript_73365/g.177036 Transcript_73365/m.177036 type:complete len:295 (+) Transcript_73365:421-1305(+)
MPSVGSSWASSVALPPPSRLSSETSVGAAGCTARSKSAVESTGSLARFSGSSGAAWAARNALVASTSAARPSADSAAVTACSSTSSSSWMRAALVGSGTRATVARWPFCSTYLSRRSTKTLSPPVATCSCSQASDSAKRRGAIGSSSYVHAETAPKPKLRPFMGEAEVDRRRNSIEFMLASMASSAKPASTTPLSVASMRSLTASACSVPAATPLRPTPKEACCSESPKPPPMTEAPRRDSSSGFCRAAVAEPSSRSLSTLRAREFLASMGSLLSNHARVTNCVGAVEAVASAG